MHDENLAFTSFFFSKRRMSHHKTKKEDDVVWIFQKFFEIGRKINMKLQFLDIDSNTIIILNLSFKL